MLAAFCTHPVRSKMRRFHPGASLSPYGCDTFSTHYTDSVTTKLQEAVSSVAAPGSFVVGGAKGGLTVQRVLKKLIKLIESNEHLTLAIRFLYTAALKKAYLTFFLWY